MRISFFKDKVFHIAFFTVFALVITSQQAFASGKIITDQITSKALEGNKLGDSNIRNITIYLPPSYDSSEKKYPVVYILHGFGGNERSYIDEVTEQFVVLMIDGLIELKAIKEMIIVMPDGRNKYGGSYYLNSELIGNYEDYIADELVKYIDNNYQTMRDRDACAISGASMGGYGCMTLAMKHPDVYCCVAAMSPPLGFEVMIDSIIPEILNENPNDMAGPNSNKQYTDYIYALAAALSPNLDNPPFFVDLPFEYPTGKIIEPIKQQWLEQDPLNMIPKYISSLKAMKGIYFDIGTEDLLGFKDASDEFDKRLLELGIDHEYYIYEGGHSDNGVERMMKVIAFISPLLPDPELPSAIDREKIAYTWGALKSQNR